MKELKVKNPAIKFYLAQINFIVGDLDGNFEKILHEINKAEERNCDLIIFSEMSICGYPCEDLWQKKYFIEACQEKISEICAATKSFQCAVLIGSPIVDSVQKKEVIRNSALLIEGGVVTKIISKKKLPN